MNERTVVADRETGGGGGPTVMVIAKTPEPGRVKTRLCPPCTPDQAATIASAALTDTFAAVAAVDGVRHAVVLDGRPGPWIPEGFAVVEQVTGGLGRRLDAAFRWSVEPVGPDMPERSGPSILVGMDTPQVSGACITSALGTLAATGVDAVIGPALDGGYWTIGFTADVVRRSPGLFDDVPMSTSGTFDAQLARLDTLGVAYRVLGTQRDIDSFDDAVAITADFPDLVTSSVVTEVTATLEVEP